MPYMPTNISPNNVMITKDEDIIFHCLIDKSDTITGVKLTLYNYYNREDKAYIELHARESYDGGYIVNSSGLVLDEGNSSELPFVAAKYDIPVFAIGIFNNTSDFFKKNLKTIGYNLELTNKKDYSIFVMEGEIENFKTNEANVELQILASPLLNQSQQVIVNSANEQYPFTQFGEYYSTDNSISHWGSDNHSLYLKNEFTVPPPEYFYSFLYETDYNWIEYDPLDYPNDFYNFLSSYAPNLTVINTTLNIEYEFELQTLEGKADKWEDIVYSCESLSVDIYAISGESLIKYYDRELLFNFRDKNSDRVFYLVGENIRFHFDGSYSDRGGYEYHILTVTGNFKEVTGTSAELMIDIDGVAYNVDSYNESDKLIKVVEDISNLKNFTNQFVTLYTPYVKLITDANFFSQYTYTKELVQNASKHPLKGYRIVMEDVTLTKEKDWKDGAILTRISNNDEDWEDISLSLEEVNQYQYYIKDGGQFISLGRLQSPSYYYYRYPGGACYAFPYYTRDKSPEYFDIYYDKPIALTDKNSNYFQIKSNTLTTTENIFSLIDTKPYISINNSINCYIYRLYSGNTSSSDTIDYSMWILKDGLTDEILHQTEREYFSIKDFEYYDFEPNKTYYLELKIHDKRNFDYSNQIEINTEEIFPTKTIADTAFLNEKAIEINLNNFNYSDDSSTLLQVNPNHFIGMKVIRNEIEMGVDSQGNDVYNVVNRTLIKDIDSMQINCLRDYGAGQGHIYQYDIIPILEIEEKETIEDEEVKKEKISTTAIFKTNYINTDDWYEINIFGTRSYYRNANNAQYEVDKNNLWTFELDANANNITFNATNTPNNGVIAKYPKVTASHQNYLSGVGSAYLGAVNNNGKYIGDNDRYLLKFYEFANNDCVKFLKLKNGMVIPVSINLTASENFTNLIGNPTKINFNWVQVDTLEASLTESIEEV